MHRRCLRHLPLQNPEVVMGLRVIGLHLQNGAVQLLGFAQPACPVMGDGLLQGGVER